MTLPRAVSESLQRFGVPADTVSWIDDLYRHLGPAVVEAVSEIVDDLGLSPAELTPQHLASVRPRLGRRFLLEHHASWREGRSTPGFWRDRSYAGAAAGVAIPLGDVGAGGTPLLERIAEAVGRWGGGSQPRARGLVLLSQNSHRNSQSDVFAFDLVPEDLDAALAVNDTEGRHHTLPGSIGETSGRALAGPGLAIVWETQPNMFKPQGARNRTAAAAYRRYRSWPLTTACAAFAHLLDKGYRVFVLRGTSLRAAHEADPGQPVLPETERLHDRTMAQAAEVLGLRLAEVAAAAVPAEAPRLAKVYLDQEIAAKGFPGVALELRA